MFFKIYANDDTGYKLINNAFNEETMDLIVSRIRDENYKTILVIRHDNYLNMDEPYYFEVLNSSLKMGGRTHVIRKNNRTID